VSLSFLYESKNMVPKEWDLASSSAQKPSKSLTSLKPNRGTALALRQGLRAVATVATIRGEE
jgi:hypothetical protein